MIVGVPGNRQYGAGDAMQDQLDGWQRCNGAAEQYSRAVQQCLSGWSRLIAVRPGGRR